MGAKCEVPSLLTCGMEQLVARVAHNHEVAGSIPVPATMKEKEKDLELYIADALMRRPYGFVVNGQRMFLYPVTLGKMYLLQRYIEQLDINMENLQRDVSLEALRLVNAKKDICLSIISFHTFDTQWELFDMSIILERKALLDKELSVEDIAALMIIILTSERTSLFKHHLGIDKEQERMNTVMSVKTKGDKNNFSFGGKSVFGVLLDTACERYGWTKEYVVWGIDYASLQLMLADKVTSIYCTDEELKKLPKWVRNTGKEEQVNGDDRDAVLKAIKSESWV